MEKYLNKIINADCLEIMRELPDKSIDLVVTSPPYDNLRNYKGYAFDFEGIAKELYRIMKVGSVIVWVVGDSVVDGTESLTSFKQVLYFKEIGFNLHDTMIYAKEGLTLNHNRYEQEFEYMFVVSKGKPKVFNPIMIKCKWFGKDSDRTGQKYGEHTEKMKRLRSGKDRGNIKEVKIKGNIWKYNTGYGHSAEEDIAFQHPAIFPEQLAADHIKSWSNENDVVLDPFNGSGTTTKTARFLNRNFIGIEISPEYCQIAENRLKQQVLNF